MLRREIDEVRRRRRRARRTAGTALAVLGLKRAVLAFLGKQCWHVWWVFVLLNVILLVVFFTSRRSSSTTPGHHRKNQESEPEDDGERTSKKQQRKRRSRRCSRSPAVERARGEREESVYQETDGRAGPRSKMRHGRTIKQEPTRGCRTRS